MEVRDQIFYGALAVLLFIGSNIMLHYFFPELEEQELKEEELEVAFSINPPFPGKEKQFERFELSHLDTVLTTSDGSVIECDCAGMVDTNDRMINKGISLLYRQYNDGIDSYLSGLPMTHLNKEFESAGMFEIRAEAAGQALALGPECSINVKLATNEQAIDFQQYQLSEATGEWFELGKDSLTPNAKKAALKENIDNWRSPRRVPFRKTCFTINYSGLLDVYQEARLPEMVEQEMKERFAQYNLEWENYYTGAAIEYRGKQLPASLMVWENKGALLPSWETASRIDFEKIRGRRYKVLIKNWKTKETFEGEANLVMPIKELIGKTASTWYSAYEQNIMELEKTKKAFEMEKEVYRIFKVAEFGIYNSDRFLKQDNNKPLMAKFELPDTALALPRQWVYVSGSQRSIIKFAPQKERHRVALVPEEEGLIFGINKDLKIFTYDQSAYKALNLETMKENASFDFKMALREEEFENAEQLKEILGVSL